MGLLVSALSCCCSCGFKACGSCGGTNTPTVGYSTRVPYIFFLLISAIVALILRAYGSEKLVEFFNYSVSVCTDEYCAGGQAALRFSFALAVFFLTMLVIVPFFPSFHHTLWIVKVLYYVALVVGFFYTPNSVFDGYTYVAKVGASIFILIQLIVFVDFSYRWNEAWREERKKQIGLVISSLLLLGISIAFWAIGYVYFAQEGDGRNCALEKFVISFTIVLSVAFTILSLSEWCEHGALVVSAVITAYCTYLLYTALKANPSECNATFDPTQTGQGISAVTFIGLVLLVLSIGYSSWTISRNRHTLFGTGDKEKTGSLASDPDAVEVAEGDAAPATEEEEKILDPETVKTNIFFHFLMFVASMYLGMILSDWGEATKDSVAGTGKGTFWANIAALWATAFLYIWTLVAPKVCTGRDFS